MNSRHSGTANFKARKPIYLPNAEYETLREKELNSTLPLLVVKGTSKSNTTETEHVRKTSIPDYFSSNVRSNDELKPETKEVVNLPVLHQSKSLELHEGARDSRTIKRSYERSETLSDKFLNIFALTGVMDESETIRKVVEANKNKGKFQESDGLDEFHSAIAPYPPVEDDEIEKHKQLNEEAEKNSVSRPPPTNRPSYIERLKLKRQVLADKRARELTIQKRKIAKRTLQKQLTVAKDINEIFIEEPLPPAPKPKVTEAKPIKLILGFKYSYAIEQYYRSQMRHFGSGISFLSDHDKANMNKEDVLNGWIVKSLGPTVLNMRARTLPSCNPIELRLRMRTRGNRKSRLNSHRTWSRESMPKPQDSFTKLNSISEERIRGHSNLSPKGHKVVISERVNVIADDNDHSEDADKHTELPIIKNCEKMFITAPKVKKEISLKLPDISVDD